MKAPRFLVISAIAGLVAQAPIQASLIFVYDFPGNSGLASDQTNPQPANAIFGDFTRNNVGATPGAPANTFGSNTWSLSASMDPTVYEGFSITAAGGYHLNLSSLSFSAYRSSTGPANVEVGLFLNGSTTAYATFDFSPVVATNTPYTFNFGPLTDADNVTTATFKFFGWNATSGIGGQFYVSNVGTNGSISSLPESSSLAPILLLLGCALATRRSPGLLRSVGKR